MSENALPLVVEGDLKNNSLCPVRQSRIPDLLSKFPWRGPEPMPARRDAVLFCLIHRRLPFYVHLPSMWVLSLW